MPKSFHRLFALLALVVIGHAQVFGLARKYVCFLNGMAYVTDADHHHTSTGLDSVHFDHYVPHSHDHGPDSTVPDDTEKHLPVKVELTASQVAAASVSAPAVLLVALWELPDFLATVFAVPTLVEDFCLAPPGSRDASPPGSVLVVRSTVFLV